jgi:hypothetical protein
VTITIIPMMITLLIIKKIQINSRYCIWILMIMTLQNSDYDNHNYGIIITVVVIVYFNEYYIITPGGSFVCFRRHVKVRMLESESTSPPHSPAL